MSEWIKTEDREPEIGQNVIACGAWCGEISGIGESDYMGLGEWKGNNVVSIDSDTYSTDIIDVHHWMPIPEHPL